MQTDALPDILTIRRIAVDVPCDPRTVQRLLEGGNVRGVLGLRIREVLRERGILPPEERPAAPSK